MSKRTPFLFFVILLASTMPLPQADAIGIGPPSFELDLQIDGSNSTTFYINSDGLEGQLIVGMEDLPFRIDPPRINMSKDDVNVPVELTFYGNETLESGVYEGKVTFLAMTGGFVAVGVKIRAKINLLGEAQVREEEEEPEMSVEGEFEEEPEAETESEFDDDESEDEEEIESDESESDNEEETDNDETNEESEDEESDEDENEDDDGNLYLIGGLAIGAIVALGLIVIWWKRR